MAPDIKKITTNKIPTSDLL